MSSYQSRHRRPRWHDPLLGAVAVLIDAAGRAVAWLLDRLAALLGGEWEDEDVSRPGAEYEHPALDEDVTSAGPGHPNVIATAKVGGVHLPLSGGQPVNPWINCAFAPEPRTGRLPSAGELDPDAPWCPGCGFANYSSGPCEICGYDDQDVPRPGDGAPVGGSDTAAPAVGVHRTAYPGPGYPGAWPSGVQREGRALHGLNHAPDTPRPGSLRSGPGHLSMWDITPARDPGFWAPRPDDTVIEAAPRIAAGRITAVAGAW